MTLLLYYFIMVFMVFLSYHITTITPIDRTTYKSDIKYLLTSLAPILVYSIFWGLRYDVGIDYLAYMRSYQIGENVDRFEQGYFILQELLKILDLPFPAIFIVTSFINICSVYIIGKERDNAFLCFLILFFWTTENVYFAQNGLRQMLAISMIFFAIHNLSINRKYKGIFFLVIAFYFHTSSVIFSFFVIGIWMLVKNEIININKYIILIIYLSIELFGQLFTIPDIPIVNELISVLGYDHHVNQLEIYVNEAASGSGIGVILRMVIYSIIILMQDDVFLNDDDVLKRIFYWSFVIGVIIWPLLNPNLIFNRICFYFSATNFVTFAFFSYELLFGNINQKKITRLIFYAFVAYNIAVMTKNYQTNGCKEYQSIFSTYYIEKIQ